MRSSKHVRDELQFLAEFNALCDVMQQVAVSRLHRAEERLTSRASLAGLLRQAYFPFLPSSAAEHPLVCGGEEGRLLVVITSDSGLVGPLYAAVIRQAVAKADASTRWIVIGQRGVRLLGDQPDQLRWMPTPSDDEAEEQMHRLSQIILRDYQRLALKDAWLVAPRFLSAAHQEVAVQQLLPLPLEHAAAGVNEQELVLEPHRDAVIEQLAATWVSCVCTESFWSARRAEFAARALHIEDARQELARRGRRVRHELFKTMHERLDVLVRETCVVRRHFAR